jgi:hypothetical protein
MSDETRWILIVALISIASLMILAWAISFAIRSALANREKKLTAPPRDPRMHGSTTPRAKSLNYPD